jgi:hypothetical protein
MSDKSSSQKKPETAPFIFRIIYFFTKTEVDLLGIKDIEDKGLKNTTEKLIRVNALKIHSLEESVFRRHYAKNISLSNRLNSQSTYATFICFFGFTLCGIFYMNDIAYFLYDQGMKRGDQVSYEESFVGDYGLIWVAVFLILFSYILWKLIVEELTYIVIKEPQKMSVDDPTHSDHRKFRESSGSILLKSLISLGLLTLFISIWGIYTAFSTYPSLPGRSYVLAGSLCIFVFVGLIFSVFLAFLLNAFTNYVVRRRIPDSKIVSELGRLIVLLEEVSSDSPGLEEMELKNEIIKSIEEISECFSTYLPQKIRLRNPYEKFLMEKEFRKIANGFQSLQSWVYTPMSDTRKSLSIRLKADFQNILTGNYHSLPKLERTLSSEVSKKDFIFSQAKKWLILSARALLPFIFLWILKLSPAELSSEIEDYLLLSSFALAALIFTIELDPNIEDKLTFIRQILKK